jgi:hypothetical protein
MKKLSLDQIPKISREEQDDNHSNALDVLANGEQAKVFISIDSSGWSDDKIVIIWKVKNKKFGESFYTKYFHMDEPGKLSHDGDGGNILLEVVE